MSSSTPPPPEPERSEPVAPGVSSPEAQDSLAPAPFVSPSLEQQISDFFGVLIGYNEAQSDLLSEQAASIGRLERAVEVSGTGRPVGATEGLGEQIVLLRQLFADEREFLIDQVVVFEALESDDVGPGIGAQDRISSLAAQRVSIIDHEVHSLNSAERVIGELNQSDADLLLGARRLYRINEDLTSGNEQQIMAIYNQESALGIADENGMLDQGRPPLTSRLIDASGYAVVATAGVGIVAVGQPVIGVACFFFGCTGGAWALARRYRGSTPDRT